MNVNRLHLPLSLLLVVTCAGCMSLRDKHERDVSHLLNAAGTNIVLVLPPTLSDEQRKFIERQQRNPVHPDCLPPADARICRSLRTANWEANRRHMAVLANSHGEGLDRIRSALQAAYAPHLPPQSTWEEALDHLRFCGDAKKTALPDFLEGLNFQLSLVGFPESFVRANDDVGQQEVTFSFSMISGKELLDILANLTMSRWSVGPLSVSLAADGPTRETLQVSYADMRTVRQLLSADPAIPAGWMCEGAGYGATSSGTGPSIVCTNSLVAWVTDPHSLRGANVGFSMNSSGRWERTEIRRRVGYASLVGDISYKTGEAIFRTVLSSPIARSNGLDFVQRIYAIPDDSPQRGAGLYPLLPDWRRWPASAQYLVNLYRSSTFRSTKPDAWDANETYAEVFVRMQKGKAVIVETDLLSPAIEATHINAGFIAHLVYGVWASQGDVSSQDDREMMACVTNGCTSDRLSARLVQENHSLLSETNSWDGWGTPFRLRLDSTLGTFSVVSAGRNRKFGDSDDMQRIWDFRAFRDGCSRELKRSGGDK